MYLFYLALSFILIHEMYAIRNHEWRIFPGLSRLSDKRGFQVFMITHIPLYSIVFWGLNSDASSSWMIGLDLFLSSMWAFTCYY